MLTGLRDAFARFDAAPVTFDDIAALVRRWIESHTFAPRTGDAGVHVVDAESARFGDFDAVQLAGVVDGEWPSRPRRNIFYGSEVLRELGWPSEPDRRDAAAARFAELARLPGLQLRVSVFSLEADALVTPSPLLATLEGMGLPVVRDDGRPPRIFEHEALTREPPRTDFLTPEARAWAERRAQDAPRRADPRYHGATDGYHAAAYAVSALERYLDCPFRFFAANVLRLGEEPEDQATLSPRRRGQLLHGILHRFFDVWDRDGRGAITADTVEAARELFATVAEPFLAPLPESEAALERARLLGSPISLGVVDVVLDMEVARGGDVDARLLEFRLDGRFTLGDPDGRPVALRGVADRIDLLTGGRLRVIDYKSGALPVAARALQAAVYALCAQERLSARDGRPWRIHEAGYVGLSGRRVMLPVVSASDDAHERETVLAAARARLHETLAGIEGGAFPPRPAEETLCRTCAYPSVCRKDLVGDE
jgi:RecB family exonuclease